MFFRRPLTRLLAIVGCILVFSGCAGSLLDRDSAYDSYFSTKGVINVHFAKHVDGSYFFSAQADEKFTEKEVLDAWHRFVAEVGRGRTAKGEPEIGDVEYQGKKGVFLAYAETQTLRARRAIGYVVFSGEMTRK